MKYIEKNIHNEPRSLKETRSTPGASYDDCNKEDIRLALLKEQGYICAYCMRRIDNNRQKGIPQTKIEHYIPQAEAADLNLNYINMIGVCKGNEDQPELQFTCDTKRGNAPLTIDPRKKSCESYIAYQPDGVIYSTNEQIDKELNEILGLNNDILVKNRRSVVEIIRNSLEKRYKKKNQTWSKSDLTQAISLWKEKKNGKHKEYCMAAIYYLEKKLARL